MRAPRIGVLNQKRPDRACDHQCEERGNRGEHRGRGTKEPETAPKPDDGGRDDDSCDREVGKLRAGVGHAESDVGLIASVQKEQRAHGGEQHRTEAKVARECGLVQGKGRT